MDALTMIKHFKEEVWQVRDAVADSQKRNLINKQYTAPKEQINKGNIVLYLDKRPHLGVPHRLVPHWSNPHIVQEVVNKNQLLLQEYGNVWALVSGNPHTNWRHYIPAS